MSSPTTAGAARRVGISLVTLQRWIAKGKLKPPRLVIRKGRAVRLWTPADIGRLKRVKQRTYRKGRGRKKKVRG